VPRGSFFGHRDMRYTFRAHFPFAYEDRQPDHAGKEKRDAEQLDDVDAVVIGYDAAQYRNRYIE